MVIAVLAGMIISAAPMVLAYASGDTSSGIIELGHECYEWYGYERGSDAAGTKVLQVRIMPETSSQNE